MSKNARELTGEEKKLWRRVAAEVKARRPHPPESAEKPQDSPRARQAAPSAKRVAPPPPSSAQPPRDRGGEKRVRRGKLDIGAALDLHGHTQDSARRALARFLQAAQARGDATVIVVTGVGRAGEGVLKRRLPDWLGEPDIRPLVSGYAQAHRAHGGAGAFYVFVKRAR